MMGHIRRLLLFTMLVTSISSRSQVVPELSAQALPSAHLLLWSAEALFQWDVFRLHTQSFQ